MNISPLLRTSLSLFVFALATLPTLASAESIEVTLIDELDGNLNSYCIDIVGGGDVDPADGLQSHTCYSYQGQLGADQAIDLADIDNGYFRMTEFDVCITSPNLSAGSRVTLETCEEGELQQFNFTENGNISPKTASVMCLTAGQETTFGRNGTSPHQIKSLTLETCEAELAAYQQWRTRSEDD